MQAIDNPASPPLVSVVIRTFNRAGTIERAIESVLSQSYKNYQLIVVDDGSVDDTRERVSGFDVPIIYFYQENSGLAAGREKGLRLASGEFIIYLDADDWWLPGALEKLVSAIHSSQSAFVFSEWLYADSSISDHFLSEKPIFSLIRPRVLSDGLFVFTPAEARKLFLYHHHAVPSGTLFRSDHLSRGFNTSARVADDWVAALDSVLNFSGACAYIKEPIWIKEIDGENIYDGARNFRRAIDFELKDLLWILGSFGGKISSAERRSLQRRLSKLYLDRSWAFRSPDSPSRGVYRDIVSSFFTYPNFSSVLQLLKQIFGAKKRAK